MDVVYYVATSIDGFIATPSGGVDWLDPFNTPDDDHGYREFEASVDVILMGSRTYEVSKALGGFDYVKKPCWVFSSRITEAPEPTAELTTETPEAAVARLSATHERAWLMGGGDLASSFQRAGLISEYRIFVAPVLLGSGIPLFGKSGGAGSVDLVSAPSYPSGLVELRYARRGS